MPISFTEDDKIIIEKIQSYCLYQERCVKEVKNKLFSLKVSSKSSNDIIEYLIDNDVKLDGKKRWEEEVFLIDNMAEKRNIILLGCLLVLTISYWGSSSLLIGDKPFEIKVLEQEQQEQLEEEANYDYDELPPLFEEKKIDCPILYGGSVSKSNIEEIISTPGIDGCLVGNSSLDGEQFAIIASKITS